MAEFVEEKIYTYSGLSSETKPTIAAKDWVFNGSRWREVDTGKVFHFNLFDDTWYLTDPILDQTTHAAIGVDFPHPLWS